jgi:hypothetical protein
MEGFPWKNKEKKALCLQKQKYQTKWRWSGFLRREFMESDTWRE